MPKDERKRQRRLARQGAESASADSAGVATSDIDAVTATGSDLPVAQEEEHSSAADSASDSEPEKKPIALAQILANPSYAERLRPRTETSSPIGQPEAERDEPAPEPIGATTSGAANVSGDEDMMPAPHARSPDYERTIPPLPPQGAASRVRSTREPLIIALLMIALIVLAVDTYFTLRLNGLSDRLAAKSSAPVVTAADRPWVGVDTIETAQFANGGQPITTVHIVNSGRQPAYDLRSNTVGSLRAVATAPPEVPAQKGPLATTGMLMPNTGGKLTFFGNTRALTADEAGNVKKGQYILWLAGRLDYKDAAGRAHVTTFRYRYDPALNSFIAAPQGNSAN